MEVWAVLATATGALSVTLLGYSMWIGTMRQQHYRHPRQ